MPEEKNRLRLDEETFGKLIEAAYVLQEHNRDMKLLEESLELHSARLRQLEEAEAEAAMQSAAQPTQEPVQRDSDYTLTLAEIVEAQNQIQIRHLEKDSAMAVVAEKITRIAKASGAGIAIVEDKMVRYRAGAGAPALPVGSEASIKKAVCATCLRTGQVLRTPDVNTEFLFDPDLCRSRGIYSLVAVPIYHNGEIVGALELYFDRLNGFVEQDIHTCQLMAGLVTEAIGRDAELALKRSMAAERSSMMAAIEKLKPSLDSIVEEPREENTAKLERETVSGGNPAVDAAARCWKCNSRLVANEQFCGECGAPRSGAGGLSSLQPRIVATSETENGPQAAPASPLSSDELAISQLLANSLVGRATGSESGDVAERSLARPAVSEDSGDTGDAGAEKEQDSSTELVKAEGGENAWASAAKAREFLEKLSGSSSRGPLWRFWQARRGDFYLAVALIAVILVARWGVISGHSNTPAPNASAASGPSVRRRPAPDADLSAFDKFLIGVGLAEAPEPPEYKGNPNAQVWVDPHTALYYCAGSDLYGKTPDGKYSTQRDAQLDQFEPALRKACD